MPEELSREKKEELARTIAGKLVRGDNKRDIILRLVGEGWPLQSSTVFV